MSLNIDQAQEIFAPWENITPTIIHNEIVADLRLNELLAVMNHVRARGFETLVEITAIDNPSAHERFKIVYLLLNYDDNARLRLNLSVAEDVNVPSLVAIYPNANWCEREVWDMYGIFFEDHPDLRRILTDYGFQGHPLRKDFPLTGFVETFYDEGQKRVIYRPVTLPQDFRQFDFMSPWKGDIRPLPGDEKATK